MWPNDPSSRPERSGVEGPFFIHLMAIGGKKVSPLRAEFTPRNSRGAPVETTESSHAIALIRREEGDAATPAHSSHRGGDRSRR